MISSITHSGRPVQSAAAAPTSQSSSKAATAQTSSSDTVQISNVAQALLKETLETPAQTTKEASGGDRQAIRLLAKEAADRAAAK
jgi:hypothetical protein